MGKKPLGGAGPIAGIDRKSISPVLAGTAGRGGGVAVERDAGVAPDAGVAALPMAKMVVHFGHFSLPDVGACLTAKTVEHFGQRAWIIKVDSSARLGFRIVAGRIEFQRALIYSSSRRTDPGQAGEPSIQR